MSFKRTLLVLFSVQLLMLHQNWIYAASGPQYVDVVNGKTTLPFISQAEEDQLRKRIGRIPEELEKIHAKMPSDNPNATDLVGGVFSGDLSKPAMVKNIYIEYKVARQMLRDNPKRVSRILSGNGLNTEETVVYQSIVMYRQKLNLAAEQSMLQTGDFAGTWFGNYQLYLVKNYPEYWAKFETLLSDVYEEKLAPSSSPVAPASPTTGTTNPENPPNE